MFIFIVDWLVFNLGGCVCLCVWHGFYDLLYGAGTGSLIRGAILNLSCCSYQKCTLCLTISIMAECLRLQTNQSYYFHHA